MPQGSAFNKEKVFLNKMSGTFYPAKVYKSDIVFFLARNASVRSSMCLIFLTSKKCKTKEEFIKC